MPLEDFDALVVVELLDDAIVTNVTMSKRRCSKPIYPEMLAAIGIIVLAGGNYDDDIINTFGISKSGFYHSRNKFLKAILGCVWLGRKTE